MTWRGAGARAVLAALAVPILAAGCLTRSERARVDAWLTCEDCTDHEADAVRVIGGRWWRRPCLARELRRDVMEGPAPSRVAGLARQLGATWARDRAYAATHPRPAGSPLPDSAAFVRHFVDAYVATYRVRAAIAIAQVAGPQKLPPIDTAADPGLWFGVRAYRSRVAPAGPP